MTTSFIEKMAEQIKVAIEIFGVQSDGVVPSDDMVIVMNPKEKQKKMLANSHGGFAGKSLLEKSRDDLDEAYRFFQSEEFDEDPAYQEGLIDGIAHSMGITRGTSMDEEKRLMIYRYEQRNRKSG